MTDPMTAEKDAPIAGHFCGQKQPHAAHTWQTPPTYGATYVIGVYQCAGLFVAPDEADSMVEAPCADAYARKVHEPHDWDYGHTRHGLEWRHCPGRKYYA
ncbi:MAG TPA: hypothetical protein VFK52_12230 [Nocardioidaceae bacterium]|nr:hypothetical protein [Nocardioidaceae bacterium]